jgi:hypothetical protein
MYMIDYKLFNAPSEIVHLYGNVTIATEKLQTLGLCSALRTFEQRGMFIVVHLLWHEASVFLVSSEGPYHSIASYAVQGDVENIYSKSDPLGFVEFLRIYSTHVSYVFTNET